MVRKKIAPTLHKIFLATSEEAVWHKSWAQLARAELRALLAVARAADRSSISPVDHPELCRALSRLERASRRGGK